MYAQPFRYDDPADTALFALTPLLDELVSTRVKVDKSLPMGSYCRQTKTLKVLLKCSKMLAKCSKMLLKCSKRYCALTVFSFCCFSFCGLLVVSNRF